MPAAHAVAYKLFLNIASASGRPLDHKSRKQGQSPADRAWILDTYAECLEAVRSAGPRSDHDEHLRRLVDR